jgi:hypothetical protein
MRRTKFNKLWYYLLIPAVGILLAVIFRGGHTAYEGGSPLQYGLHAIIMTSGLWIGCMLIVGFLWNKYPWEKTPVRHLILEIFLILIYTNGFSYGLYIFEKHLGFVDESGNLFLGILITNLITLLITAIHEAIEFYQQWKYNFSKSVRLEKDNIEAKYEMLKTQINPHFLFNSLNSLVTMVEENEEAVTHINNLSEFLRYMLKSRDRQLVLVREEVNVLNKFIDIQRSRFKENLDIVVDVDEKYYHYSIPPLVLQMLVENCIKHNIISKEKPLHITIRAEKGWLSVENNLQKKTETPSTGQGLRNISERYRFFTTQQVKIHETNRIFKVSIPLLEVDL